MAYLYIGFGKTNQFGGRDTIIPFPGNSDPALDPVRHLHSLLSNTDASPNQPAFSYGSKFITYSIFTSRLKDLLKKAGLNPALYSGHSFRRGGATYLHECGGDSLMIQASGDWSSQCFTRYLYLSESERLKAQSLISRGITDSLWCKLLQRSIPFMCTILPPLTSCYRHFLGFFGFSPDNSIQL